MYTPKISHIFFYKNRVRIASLCEIISYILGLRLSSLAVIEYAFLLASVSFTIIHYLIRRDSS